jgi:hypothetical protein
VIPATILTWVWSGRKRARRGTCLKDRDEAPGAEEGGRRQRAVEELQQASSTAGMGEGRGNQASEDPHPKAELQRRLMATTSKAVTRLGFTRQKAVAAVLVGPRARGGSFVARPQDLGVRARDAVRWEGRAVPWLDSSSSPSLARGRGDPDRWIPAVRERKNGRRKLACGRAVGPRRKRGAGRWTRPRGGGKMRKKG